MAFAPLLTSITIMAVIIGIGALTAKHHPLTAESRKLLVSIIVNVAMPCIILNGIFQSEIDAELLQQIMTIFLVAIALSAFGIFLGYLGAKLLRIPGKRANELAILSGLGNTGFIGLPLCAALFGHKGALLAAVYDAGLDVVIWTVAATMLQEKKAWTWKNAREILNIPMIAILVGMLIALINWHPPQAVVQLTSMLAALASPMAMLYIGMLIPPLLKNSRSTGQSLRLLGMPLTLKLVVYPLVVAGILAVISLPLPKEITQVVLVQVAMPTIAMASILFARYAADEEMGAMTTVVSTLVGLLTIPVVVMVCGQLIG
ncbi:AEC family transporter [Brevibacillus dissolubilis]|uniref:AEC family transporter n=1 Tax=Brevibacillus dissolubilis TaxID=1844116 RepID=UPI00111709E1|nr:AEC family transporter [Brevibacillus dissolubilis]